MGAGNSVSLRFLIVKGFHFGCRGPLLLLALGSDPAPSDFEKTPRYIVDEP